MKALLLALALFPILQLSLQAEEKTYIITNVAEGDTLNIRSGPGMNFPVVATLANQTSGVKITGDSVMNGADDWLPISFAAGKGWTRGKYLTEGKEPRAVTAETEKERNAKALEIYQDRSGDAKIHAQMFLSVYNMAVDQSTVRAEKKLKVSPRFLRKLNASLIEFPNENQQKKHDPAVAVGEILPDAVVLEGVRTPFIAISEGYLKNVQPEAPVMLALTEKSMIMAAIQDQGNGVDMVFSITTLGEKGTIALLHCIPPKKAAEAP